MASIGRPWSSRLPRCARSSWATWTALCGTFVACFGGSTEYDLSNLSMSLMKVPVTHKQATMIKDQQQHALKYVALSMHIMVVYTYDLCSRENLVSEALQDPKEDMDLR